ncbi:MAG: OmpW family outer membrane protein [Smithella sp.]
MKKMILFVSAVLLLSANAAMADSIAGKVGITGRFGASYVGDSKWTVGGSGLSEDIKADLGYSGGGGVMYGITDNLAVNFDVNYLQADLNANGQESGASLSVLFGRAKTVDFALGAQWRFIPKSQFVPYVEGGLDVLWNNIDVDPAYGGGMGGVPNLSVATTYGVHLSVGGDFFFNRHVALNAEIRGLLSTQGDVKSNSFNNTVFAKYDPSNISAFLGMKFFFP